MPRIRLTRRYIAALSMVALLSIGGQIVVQLALSRQADDSAFVNIAGRQRMLSQRITWLSLRLQSEMDAGERQQLGDALQAALGQWHDAHHALRFGDEAQGTTAPPGPVVGRLLVALEGEMVGMRNAAMAVLAHDGRQPERVARAVDALLSAEPRFLEQMDRIVFTFAAEAEGRVHTLRVIEAALLALVLITLGLEVVLIFRPAAARVEDSLERLAKSEAQKSAMLAALPDVLLRIDAEGRCAEHLAVPPGAEPLLDRVCPLVQGRLGVPLNDARSGRGEPTLDLCLGPTDDQVALELRVVALPDEEALVLVRDVTALRRLERRLLTSTEEVQRSLGRELHDGLCQELAGLNFMTRMAADAAAEGKPVAPKTLAQLSDLVEHALEAGRRLSRGLYPLHLDEGGLVRALEALCARASAAHGVPVHCVAAADLGVEHDVALQLLRIAQEAVGNALRHGKPSRVEVSLDEGDAGLELVVLDDGVGLPSHIENPGLGLQSMVYRAQLVGARLDVSAQPGGGTRVWCMLPT